MDQIFDRIAAKVAQRDGLIAAATVGRMHRIPSNYASPVRTVTKEIRAIRNTAAADLGLLPSFTVDKFGTTFRVDFHKKNGRWSFINLRGLHQIYASATNLSTGKVHIWNGARKERLQCSNMPTGIRTARVIGTDAQGEPIYEIKENPLQAALDHFRHAALLGITEEVATDATPEWGNTTTVVYPDAGTSTGGTVDGVLASFNANQAWATHHDAAVGTSALDTVDGSVTAYSAPYIVAGSSSNTWTTLNRGAFSFDTSAVGGGTISSAAFSQYTHAKVDNFTTPAAPVTHLRGQTLAANDALAVGDFDGGGAEDFATLAWASVLTSQYNDYALNAAGIAAIVTDGITAFSLRYSYDVDDSPPTWQASKVVRTSSYFADTTGTANDPKLTIEHAAGGGGGGGGNRAASHAAQLVIEGE